MIVIRCPLLLACLLMFPAVNRAADAEPYLPNDSEVVISVNLEQLLNSPLGQRYLRGLLDQALKDNPQVQESLKAIELDPAKDIRRVTVALWGKENVFAVVGGKFSPLKIAGLAAVAAANQKDKFKIHAGDGVTIYELVGDDNKPLYAAVASDTTLLLSPDKTFLKDALKKSSPKVGKVNKDLAALISKADAKQTAWLAALPGIVNAFPLPGDNPQQKQALDALESITGSLSVDANIRLSLALNTKTAPDAQTLGKQVAELVNLGKLFLPVAAKDNPEIMPLVEILNAIRLVNKGKSVTITTEMTGSQMDKAIKSQPKP